MSSSSHRDAHPYGRSNDDVRRRDQRRRRHRRLRITQLIVFSIAMIAMICALVYAWKQLTADGGQQAAGASDAGASTPVAADGTHCPEPGAKPAAPESVKATVLNGTTRTGLAGTVSETLEARGFTMGEPGNAKSPKSAVTIVHGPDGYLEAAAVAAQFPKATLQVDEREDASVDVLIGLDYEDLASKDTAAARAKKPVATPEGCPGATEEKPADA